MWTWRTPGRPPAGGSRARSARERLHSSEFARAAEDLAPAASGSSAAAGRAGSRVANAASATGEGGAGRRDQSGDQRLPRDARIANPAAPATSDAAAIHSTGVNDPLCATSGAATSGPAICPTPYDAVA